MALLKIRKSGSGSIIVTLPPDVLAKSGFKLGDKVLVEARLHGIEIRRAKIEVQQ